MGTLVGIACCVGNKRAAQSGGAPKPTDFIKFADPVMQKLCAETWGDGENITYEQASTVNEIPTDFAYGNTEITSFDELKHFTSLTKIGIRAFKNCKNLVSVIFPKSITSTEVNCFEGANLSKLKEFNLPLCKNVGNYTFNGCTNLVLDSIQLPSCTYIGWGGFQKTSINLEMLELPKIVSIQKYAFMGCKLLNGIDIGDGVKTIAQDAFSYLRTLKIVICRAVNPPTLGAKVFDGNSADRKIYVPDDSVEAYKTATNWTAYADAILPLSQYKE